MKMKKDFILMKTFAYLGLICLILLFFACEHEQGTAPPGLKSTLSSIQDKILTPRCVNAGCHPGGGAPMSLQKGVAFGNLVNLSSAFPGLLRVRPSFPDSSVLYLKVTADPKTGNRMPLGDQPLKNKETGAIRQWIEGGALNN